LHAALRNRLGAHVTQKGSLVAPDRLRFDISQPRAVTAEELALIEQDVNEQIRINSAVRTGQMTPDEAVEQGALALFGEKYGDEVRVVSMGEADEETYSTELCGGTHVRSTGDIGAFTVISESAVAAGVRRIEALTGDAALAHFHEQGEQLRAAADLLKTTPADLPERIGALLEERKKLERDLSQARQALALGGGGEAKAGDGGAKEVAGVSFSGRRMDDVPAKELRGMVDAAKQKLGSGVVAFIAVNEGKAALTVGVTDDLTERFSAVDLVRVGSAAVGGKGGGGRPDMAQAGGPDGNAAEAALTAIEEAIQDIVAAPG
jgi:alanyl-tRNA synthetase